MNPISLGVMGAMSSLVALPLASASHAATTAAPPARSYAQLLEPIPNATERLRLTDAVAVQGDARLVPAAYRYRWVRQRVYVPTYRRYRRHYYYGYRYYAPAPPLLYYRRYYHHHHHHHHHHHGYY